MSEHSSRTTIVWQARGGVDAIDQYSRKLASALDGEPAGDGLAAAARNGGAVAGWVVLQYNPFLYGRAGIAPRLLLDALRFRRRSRARLALMIHEAWIEMNDPKSALIGLWQRLQLRVLISLADTVMASTERVARELGSNVRTLSTPSTIEPVDTSREAERARLGVDGALVVALFGRSHPSRALEHAQAAIAALTAELGPGRVVVLNLGADAPPVAVPAAVRTLSPGPQSDEQLSRSLWASDLALLPFHDGVSAKRSTLMAALAHGVAVLSTDGRSTDQVLREATGSLVLTPVEDQEAYVRAALALARDPARARAIGESGRRLYRERFDWPVITARMRETLDSTEVVFVANDVGGVGGMERQSEELVKRLLRDDRRVTVLARTCSLPDQPGLRFRRVPTPSRPASFAYPAFIAAASLMLLGRRASLLHTTGAIIAGRADLSTVHYCHRAAARKVEGSRASRASFAYRVNARISGVLSRAGESWCYRPARARMLCAVSTGVADELTELFPTMRGMVRTVPNGVDASVFRPDPMARAQLRGRLGITEDELLALFVGGDWERKGLPFGAEAIAQAPGWHLAVAGPGDPAPLLERARAAGCEARLHFLGRVTDMPPVYAAADAFVFPTTYEAFPLVVLEAAASGLPLLVTKVNGVEEVLEDGVNGFFITRAVDDIASRLNELAADRVRTAEMAAASRTTAATYSWDAMAAGYMKLYDELTGARSAAG